MGCTSSDPFTTWKENMLLYEAKVLSLAELDEPYWIISSFTEVVLDDIPLEVRTHRLVKYESEENR